MASAFETKALRRLPTVFFHRRSASSQAANPNPNPTAAAYPASSDPADISPAEAYLLDKFHFLIKDHHRTHPNPDPSTSPLRTSPFRAVLLLLRLISPPSFPSLARNLIRRCASLRRGIPFPKPFPFSTGGSPLPLLPLSPPQPPRPTPL
ncbi:hypothetical protein HPP92_004552 [Vanilla planifolia]|uniref:Uncharacterized protein n=1 Tax=Vanilla planifolia TaxID=51239 RepID=A0A835RN10_VANPL|nr:hypothetical protein HPP92_004552 [Vanilla planifolia]